MKISDIKIQERFRKDLHDLSLLAESIKVQGLLSSIAIDENNVLVCGHRRLCAVRDILGWTEIDVRRVNVTSLVEGEYDENNLREGFTLSEKVAIEQAVLIEIGRRQGRRTELRPDRDEVATLAIKPGERTLAFSARKAGFTSKNNAARARAVVASGNLELIKAMDEGKIALTPAADIAKQPKEEQNELIQQKLHSRTSDAQIREAIINDPNESDRSIQKKLKIDHRRCSKIRGELIDSGVIDIHTGKEYIYPCVPTNAPPDSLNKEQEKVYKDIIRSFTKIGSKRILTMRLEGEWPNTVDEGRFAQHLTPQRMASAILYHWNSDMIIDLIDRLKSSPKLSSSA